MSRKLIIVTGPMRSGTSMVAQTLHLLGVPVADEIRAPLPPRWQLDWEDPAVAEALWHVAQQPENPGDGLEEFLVQHLSHRLETHWAVTEAFGLPPENPIAIKSPLLPLVWLSLMGACAELVLEPVLVVCYRDWTAVQSSVRASFHPDQVEFALKLNERLLIAVDRIERYRRFDLMVSYEGAMEFPTALARDLAKAAGATATCNTIARAARAVGVCRGVPIEKEIA